MSAKERAYMRYFEKCRCQGLIPTLSPSIFDRDSKVVNRMTEEDHLKLVKRDLTYFYVILNPSDRVRELFETRLPLYILAHKL